jgi:uncharacterized membrane protein YfcA
MSIIEHYSLISLIALAILATTAGFIDAIVGGGGLIQIPALLINLPNVSLPTVFGTNKIAALSGTSFSAYQYSKRIKFDFKLLVTIALFAFIASYFGASVVSHLSSESLKPAMLVILIFIAIYTFFKKDLGNIHTKTLSPLKQQLYGSIIGVFVGFYDGFFGPGTGSFFVLGFVVILGFDFLHASAYAKIINCLTNISALILFIKQGNYILEIAVLLAICNVAGSIIGTKLALKQGNKFIRIIFLVIVCIMIVRYGYDVIYK